jgi:hypothetical protein
MSNDPPRLNEFDDNVRSVDGWIAYHYFVMNLRYLVILPDPVEHIVLSSV